MRSFELLQQYNSESTPNTEKTPKIHVEKFTNILPIWIERHPEFQKLSGTFRHTLKTIANHCDAPGKYGELLPCFTGEHLREKLGMCRQNLTRHITRLAKLGFVVRLSAGGGRLGSVLGIPGREGQLDEFAQPAGVGACYWSKSLTRLVGEVVAERALEAREKVLALAEKMGAVAVNQVRQAFAGEPKPSFAPKCVTTRNKIVALPSHNTLKNQSSLHVSPCATQAENTQGGRLANTPAGRGRDEYAQPPAGRNPQAQKIKNAGSIKGRIGHTFVLSGCHPRQIHRVVVEAMHNGWTEKQMVGLLQSQKIRGKGFGWSRTILRNEPARIWGKYASMNAAKGEAGKKDSQGVDIHG